MLKNHVYNKPKNNNIERGIELHVLESLMDHPTTLALCDASL